MDSHNETQLTTIWSENIDGKTPLPEYPRPQLVRTDWMSLNGIWDFCMLKTEERPAGYDRRILVPYCVESVLSGIGEKVLPEDRLWYRRSFSIPRTWDSRRILLHFDAVDHDCEVWLNGTHLGTHSGGYLPFTFEVTGQLQDENVLEVRVRDSTDIHQQRGKQSLSPRGIFYTATSGIWQSVWLEPVSQEYISRLKITPDLDSSSIRIAVCSSSNAEAAITVLTDQGKELAQTVCETNRETVIRLPEVRCWCPEDPYLYRLQVRLKEDTVTSYFGMRKYSVINVNGRNLLALNNRPVFHLGVLDQGYWPESLLTPVSDQAMIQDIESMKELGYNVLRKHIKIEPLRWYYHCDRLGMMVWQDMVSGGDCRIKASVYARNILHIRTDDTAIASYRNSGRENESDRKMFEEELTGMIDLLYNSVSISCWVIFNECWGQFDSRYFTAKLKELDPGRFIDHASGWYDQKCSDFISYHVYFTKLKLADERDPRVQVISECGGFGYRQPDHAYGRKQFSYARIPTREKLQQRYENFISSEAVPLIRKGLAGLIYTQLSDVETENNGIYTYDRKVCKFDKDRQKAVNERLIQTFYGQND